MITLAQAISQARARARLTRLDISRRTGFGEATISLIERGKKTGGGEILRRLLKILPVNLEERNAIELALSEKKQFKSPPQKKHFPESELMKYSEVRNALAIGGSKLTELLREGYFDVRDMRPQGASRAVLRITRASFNFYLSRLPKYFYNSSGGTGAEARFAGSGNYAKQRCESNKPAPKSAHNQQPKG